MAFGQKETGGIVSSGAIRLGVMPPLTGLVEIYGQEISLAAQIACQEVNESGGVLGRPLELIIEDDGSLPESAVSAANKLVDQHHCAAIIGNLLSNSRIAVAYRVAEPRKIPYLNFSFYEGSISSRYFFHFAALPNQQIDKMIPCMQKMYGPRMFFAGNNYEWPRGSIDAAKRILELSQGQVVGEEYCPIGVGLDEIERLLDKVAESGADVFVPYFAGIDQVHLLSAFTARGLKKRMAVVMGHYDEVMASHLSPEVRQGFYSSNTYFMSVDTPENRRYLERLNAMAGITGIWPQGNGILTNFGEGTYLCVKAFALAANKAGSIDPEALIKALETICLTGPQGTVEMDPVTHHAQVNTYLSCCQADGTFTIIEQFGAIAPLIPERYRPLRMGEQAQLDEDVRTLARMMEQMTEAVFLVDATNGTIIYTNTSSERMFGYQRGELTGKQISTLNATVDKNPEEIAAEINAILYRKGVWRGEIRTIKKDGSLLWSGASVSAFTHPRQGEVWMAVYKDINDRKEAEAELIRINESLEQRVRERTAELSETNARLSAEILQRQEAESSLRITQFAVDHASDNLFWITPDAGFVNVNDSTCRRLGYSRDELLGMTVFDVDPAFPREAWEAHWREIKERKSFTIETSHRTKAGKVIPVEVTVNYVEYEGAEYNFAFARDISERKRAEEAIRKTNEELEGRLAELKRMNQLFVDRELRMIELKEKIKELEKKNGE